MRSKTILNITLIAFVCGILFAAALMASSVLPAQDLTQYWSAAHLARQNPYSTQLVSAFEKAASIGASDPPLVLKNPPWAIPFILPLGLFSFRVAFAVWNVFSVVAVLGCAGAVWRWFEEPNSIVSILLPILFGPTIVLLMLGQWTVLVLIGITGFLIAADRRHDWIAGAFLLLVMGKPHVALLFLVAMLLWVFQTRRWAVFYSAALALAASSGAMLALNPHIFAQFLDRTREVVGETVPYPNLGGKLYALSGQHWLAVLPQIAGVLWVLWYWRKHRREWAWKTEGMLVLAVSITCSYYSYPYDEILVLPALIAAFVTGNRRVFLGCFVLTELGYAFYLFQFAGRFGFTYMFLSWTAAAWLLTYSASTSLVSRSHAMPRLANDSGSK